MAGTIVVDRIESDASYASTINVAGQITFSNTVNFGAFAGTAPVAGFYLPTTNNLAFTTTSTERMRITSAGNVGIGTSSPSSRLTTSGSTGTGNGLTIVDTDYSNDTHQIYGNNSLHLNAGTGGVGAILFRTAATERMRLTSAGKLGIGNSSPDAQLLHVGSGAGGGSINGYTRLAIEASDYAVTTIKAPAANFSQIIFTDPTSSNLGGINFFNSTNATPNSMTFLTGGGNQRMRIDSSGNIFTSGNYSVLYPGSGNATTGIFLESDGQLSCSRDNTTVARFNRNSTDGTMITFARQGTDQGSISVSGSTVSYNAFAGSHWSQLSDGSKPVILRGTVLDSINELVQWPDEPTTERLCKVKVSNTVGSKKVYGVFMDWDNDWTVTNDMYVTAVGAFICRVNASVTVQEGDLLESNGDGTARVQADDIIHSSTIGKVTCTEKTHQYDDGSYCVPTVLYCG